MSLPEGFVIERFDPASATDAELIARFRLEDLLLEEYDPDAESLPDQRRLELARSGAGPHRVTLIWVIRAPDHGYTAIAWLGVGARADGNRSCPTCSMLVGVHPLHRRRGMGRALLREVVGYADRHGYTVIENVWGKREDRSRSARRRYGLAGDGHRLDLTQTNWPLLHRWIGEGRRLAPGARVETYHEELPASLHAQYLPLWRHLQSREPLPALRAQLPVLSAQWQAWERDRKAGSERWLSLAVRECDGRMSALIEAIYNPAAAKVILVRVSGVLDEFVGRGRGKWLHAELLFRIKALFPRVEHVGFRQPPVPHPAPPISNGMWPMIQQVRTAELLRRLR